jgi:Fe-S cluster biogenesis protein NfuA
LLGLICNYMFGMMTDIPLFRDLTPEQQKLIEPLFEVYTCPADTVIFEQGDEVMHLYLILRGKVAIQYKPYDGPPITLTQLSKGDVFGWSVVTGSKHYTSGIVAKEHVEAIRVRGSALRQFCVVHPETGMILLDKLAEIVSPRWKNAHIEVKSILQQSMGASDCMKGEGDMVFSPVHSEEQQIRVLIEQISAYVEQFHGGSVEFVSLSDNNLKVRLGGACIGCPLSPTTLHGWVAGTIHQFFPNIQVDAVF